MSRLLHRRIVQDIRKLLETEGGSRMDPSLASDAFIHLVMEAASRAAGLPVAGWTGWSSLQPPFPDYYSVEVKGVAQTLLNEIPQEDWRQDPRLAGWLYQYWLASPKDRLFRMFKNGAKAAHGDIPAVTQLFTPVWIARYLAENTLGRLWQSCYPESGLLRSWSYFDRCAEPELPPSLPFGLEEWTILDPACGCGHLLAAAFDLLMEMYLESGTEPAQAARAILTRHLYGLDIDPAAVRICRFVLLLKAASAAPSLVREAMEVGIAALTRESGFRFGSLDRAQPKAVSSAADIHPNSKDPNSFLTGQYHVVITNPPYLGRRNMDKELGDFLDRAYTRTASDLSAAFMERCRDFLRPNGFFGAITPQSWMFLSGLEELRAGILTQETIISMLHLGARAFEDNNGQVVQTVCFILRKTTPAPTAAGSYWKLTEGASLQKEQAYRSNNSGAGPYRVQQAVFRHIPGLRLAYELPDEWAMLFRQFPSLDRFYTVKKGMDTGCNERYVRLWHEVPPECLSIRCPEPSRADWFPYAKGGGPQKWYGNHYFVVFWRNNGEAIRRDSRSNLRNFSYFGRPGVTWSTVSTGKPGFRLLEKGFLFDNGGSCLFPMEGKEETLPALLAYLNSEFTALLLSQMNPTLNIQPGDVARLPLDETLIFHPRLNELGKACLQLAKAEWDETERSWDYAGHPAAHSCRKETVEASLLRHLEQRCRRTAEMNKLEQAIDTLIHGHYGLPPLSTQPAAEEETAKKQEKKEAAESLLAYAAGCLFGTYSFGTGNQSAAPPARIISDKDWVPGLKDWLARLWNPAETDRNMEAIARFLGLKLKEAADERIRRYFSKDWYPRHCREFGGQPRYLRICSGSRQVLQAFVPVLQLEETIVAEAMVLAIRNKEELLQALDEAYADQGHRGSLQPGTERLEPTELKLDIAELDAFILRLRTFEDMSGTGSGSFRQQAKDARELAERYRPVFDC